MSRSAIVPPDRGPYRDDQVLIARTETDGDLVTIFNLRDKNYPAVDEVEVNWDDRVFDLRELTNLWLYTTYFSRIRGIAHIELGFEFADNNNVIASFEIRPLKGQHFSATSGFAKTFEITLRWATERDILLARTMRSTNHDDLYMFEADITHSRMIDLFHAATRRTNDLYQRPEWYNTARNACGGNAIDLVHEILPGHVRRTPFIVFPGLLPKIWAKHGYLKLNGTFEETMAEAKINDRLEAIAYADDFSKRLHDR